MDAPKLTLVDNTFGEGGASSNSDSEAEGAWLVDACDLEGLEVEEIEDDGSNGGYVKEGQGEEWQLVRVNSVEEEEGDNEDTCQNNSAKSTFEFSKCSECDEHGCSRPVKEICGHVKCRSCYMASDDGCSQCRMILEGAKEKNSIESHQQLEEEDDFSSDEEDEERVVVKPGQYIFELGEASGGKSLAVVSAETLKELGINPHAVSVEDNEPATTTSQNVVATSSRCTRSTEEANNVSESMNSSEGPPSKLSKLQKGRTRKKPVTDHIILISSVNSVPSGNMKKYKCLKCDKDFAQEYQRKYHLYCNPANGRRPYICEDCSEEFVSLSHYQYHHRSKHTGEKPYECPVCLARFIQKVKLNRHMTLHTTSKSQRRVDPSLYICAYCKKRFNSLSSCRRHIKNHTDDRPFKCQKCEKAFKQKYALQLHTRTHLNQRPFQCQDCDRAFSTAKDLRRHQLCHTGELPFECGFGDCKRKFSRKDNLERHIRQTHKLTEKMTKLLGTEAAKNVSRNREGHAEDNNERIINVRDVAEIITGI